MKKLKDNEQDILPGQINFIDFLEEYNQEKEVDIAGFMDDGYCPRCKVILDDLIEECPYCHQKLNWDRWRRINLKE